ncbi:MAG: glycosyltransferase family 9 protein [Elusimicrobia bacterium]|nr:glycosyltransferase family 9 protein [Elusimicrobiota bacterium]MDE2237948.1 glycosyltransferase family 9 protein [Elusimicrobiota bacterium]MDE2424883.1 glycosyltransferase family 9 protein [Elusimicrobiota bacterium]
MQPPRRILAIQLRRIGDVILCGPALAALKRRFPDSELDFLVEPPAADAVLGLPCLHEVILYRARRAPGALLEALALRRRKYDLVVDFMGNPRTALLAALSGAPRRAGPAHVFHRWAYNIPLPQSPETVYAAREKIRMLAPLGVPEEEAPLPSWPRAPALAPENVVALAPASRRPTRRWPARHYAELGRLLRKRYGCELLILWGPGERELAERVAADIGPGARVCPQTPRLRDVARRLAACRLLVTNCGGLKHVAVALGLPTVTVHGSSDPAAWNPPGDKHLVVRRESLPCIGCRGNTCPTELECLEGLPASEVLAACAKLLDGGSA